MTVQLRQTELDYAREGYVFIKKLSYFVFDSHNNLDDRLTALELIYAIEGYSDFEDIIYDEDELEQYMECGYDILKGWQRHIKQLESFVN